MSYESAAREARPIITTENVLPKLIIIFTAGASVTACGTGVAYELMQPSKDELQKLARQRSILVANPDIAQNVIDNTENHIVYKHGDTTFHFYLAKGAPVPNQGHLDKMWGFIETQTDPITNRFRPPKEAFFFVGNFSDIVSVTPPNELFNPASVNSIVNLKNREAKLNPLAVEFCQAVLLPASMEMFNTAQQEQDCNTFGVAMFGVENNLSYQDYVTIATKEGFLPNGKKIAITPYPQTVYERLVLLFGQPKPDAESEHKRNSIAGFAAIREYLITTGKKFEDLAQQDFAAIIKTTEYLKEIYQKYIAGDLNIAFSLARSAIKDNAYVSILSEKANNVPAATAEYAPAYLVLRQHTAGETPKPKHNLPPKNSRPATRKVFFNRPVAH